jgi:poly(3-hydroxybutyrate) depolymerase
LAAVQAQATESLKRYNININETTISGLSAGGFMAHQFHLAHSDIINGVAIIAGGPYQCAHDKATLAVDKCMQGDISGGPQAEESQRMAYDAQSKGLIPPLANIADDKVYIFTGTNDKTVKHENLVKQNHPANQSAGAAVRDLYKLLNVKNDNITFIDDVPAGHAIVAVRADKKCGTTESPYIVYCQKDGTDIDQAGDILKFLAGATKQPSTTLSGEIINFNQGEFANNPNSISMANSGYVYVPGDCVTGKPCKLHVALHGCGQNTASIGKKYVTDTGYLHWADSNNIVVLFPQAISLTDIRLTGAGFNLWACWNWWGYGGDGNYATRIGYQISAIRNMIDRLSGGGM